MRLDLGLLEPAKALLNEAVEAIRKHEKLGDSTADELTALGLLVDILSAYSVGVVFRQEASPEQVRFAEYCQDTVRIFNVFKESRKEPEELKDLWKPPIHFMDRNHAITCRSVNYLFTQSTIANMGELVFLIIQKMLALGDYYKHVLNLPQFLLFVRNYGGVKLDSQNALTWRVMDLPGAYKKEALSTCSLQ